MLKYTGGYVKGTNNFVICNIDNYEPKYKLSKVDKNILYILKNILQRGNPVWPSYHLREKFDYFNTIKNNDYWHYMSAKQPLWSKDSILGNDQGYNPAYEFYKDKLSDYLNPIYTRFVIPEALITDIVNNEASKGFIDQRVDFYLPEAKLVIEIDGIQHQEDQTTKENDQSRDEFLTKHGCTVIRIPVSDIRNDVDLTDRFQVIKSQINRKIAASNEMHKQLIDDLYKEQAVILNSIYRYQMVILTLLEEGILSLHEENWYFSVNNNNEYDCIHEAIIDLFNWFRMLYTLQGLEFQVPKIHLNQKTSEDTIHINFSLFRRYTDEYLLEPNEIYVRTDYFYENDYFQLSIGDSITYDLEGDVNKYKVDALRELLLNIYNYDDFKEGQLNIIKNVLALNSTIGILPTGGGKSLCYHFSALLQPKPSIVIAPIKSLMKDQVKNLIDFSFNRVDYINSNLNTVEKELVKNQFLSKKLFLLIVSPERFQEKQFMQSIENFYHDKKLGYFVLDEVHCLSEWGHDFRTSYLNLSHLLQRNFSDVVIIGLTATASANVLRDIKKELNINDLNLKALSSLDRKELNFKVIPVNSGDYTYKTKKRFLLNVLDEIINENKNSSYPGIIFTKAVNTENGCYQIAQDLQRRYGIEANFYSGSKPKAFNIKDDFSSYQETVQDNFIANKFDLLVATKSFGMGINKTNIRFTIHFGTSASLESLYQEAGRAGRDGQVAENYIIQFKEANQQIVDEVFNKDTTIEKVVDILDEKRLNGDINDSLYFWKVGQMPIIEEFTVTLDVLAQIINPKNNFTIKCQGDLKRSIVEKALYRLSVLKIVNNWYIRWSRNIIIEAVVNTWNEDTVLEALTEYISKHEFNFKLDCYLMRDDVLPYLKELNIKDTDRFKQALLVLLIWTYENITYIRKMQIKTVYDYCENYGHDPQEFKQMVNNYFVFNDFNIILDEMVENPQNISLIEKLFMKKDELDDEKVVLKEKKELETVFAQLYRYIESYKNNPLLTISHQLCELFLHNKEKYNLNIEEFLQNYEDSEYPKILNIVLNIGKWMETNKKIILSQALLKAYPSEYRHIYASIGDDYSYSYIVRDINHRLSEINEVLYGKV